MILAILTGLGVYHRNGSPYDPIRAHPEGPREIRSIVGLSMLNWFDELQRLVPSP
jgi:hypothetical protein